MLSVQMLCGYISIYIVRKTQINIQKSFTVLTFVCCLLTFIWN